MASLRKKNANLLHHCAYPAFFSHNYCNCSSCELRSRRRNNERLYPSYFELHVRWLQSFTPVTYFSKLLGIHALAAFLQLELFRV
ncbi:hypothetical protein CEG88_25260 [Klebsiella aerogenes]|nr:hypothetical protein CEG88_25260 [Klebsiella aerogenes]